MLSRPLPLVAWTGDPNPPPAQAPGADAMTPSHCYVPADATVLEDSVVGEGLPWSSRIDRGELLMNFLLLPMT